MLCRGTLKNLSLDWVTRKPEVTLQLDARAENIEKLKDKPLSVEIKQWRKKRSLDANAYAWVLISKIAEAMNSDKDSIYELMLQDYGFPYLDENGNGKKITVLKGINPCEFGFHVKYIGDRYMQCIDSDYAAYETFSDYFVIRGSSEYDTKEMSYFIDRIIDEAKELGIETLPPDELERMMQAYGKKHTAK